MNIPSLKDSLERWTGPPKLEPGLEPRRAKIAASKVAKQLGDVEMKEPEPYDLPDLYERILAAWRRDSSLYRVSALDLRRLPFVVFYSPTEGTRNRGQDSTNYWLGAQTGIVREYERWLSNGLRAVSVRELLKQFLGVYPVDLPTFEDLRQLLQMAMEGTSSLSPSLEKWRQRCLDFGLLQEGGDLSFVENLVSASDPVDDFLGRAGFEAGLARSGFLASGIRKHLPNFSTRLTRDSNDGTELERLLTLLECEGKLRFDDLAMRSEVAAALLGPCAEHSPEPATKKRLQPFFLHHFGDPRLQSGKHRWSGIPEEIRRVVIRWLVERALEQFFLLVKDTALDRHWRYREAFWRAFLPLEPDVWFVLGSRAERLLEKMNEKKNEDEATSILRGAEGNQSVLLLRLPGVTIAEWSHNGACRFWLDGTPDAPALYRSAYFREDLMGKPDHRQPHYGSSEGLWQDEIAHWLRDNTGVEIDRAEYFPDRLQERQTDHRPRYTPSARESRSQATAGNSPDAPSRIDRTETAPAALRELREVRDAVMAARRPRVDLRAFMDANSPAWVAYTADHGAPGYGTRKTTILDRLDSTIARLRSLVLWRSSSN